MELFSNVLILVFVIGGFVVLSAGTYMGIKPMPVQGDETAQLQDDPFEVELDWKPSVLRSYILNRVPNV